jgi:hypothetical protein
MRAENSARDQLVGKPLEARVSQIAVIRLGIRNKSQIARFIAARFPELADYVPRERKPWTSEDPRMAIFDAAAFAFVLRMKTSPLPHAETATIPDSSGVIPQ